MEALRRRMVAEFEKGAGRHDDPDVYGRYVHVMAADPAVKVHIYGKPVRPGRKIGHVTVTGDRAHRNSDELADRARRAASYLRWGKEDGD